MRTLYESSYQFMCPRCRKTVREGEIYAYEDDLPICEACAKYLDDDDEGIANEAI